MDDLTEQIISQIKDLVKELFERTGFQCSFVDFEQYTPESGGPAHYLVKIHSEEDCAYLLGRHGANFRSFEHLARLVIYRALDKKVPFSLDLNGYRQERRNHIIDLAKIVAQRVRETKKAEALFPMPAFERRIVHMELVAMPDIITESIGEEPKRRIVVKPLV